MNPEKEQPAIETFQGDEAGNFAGLSGDEAGHTLKFSDIEEVEPDGE
ncbi:Hypothetical protein NGAL_HAMBI2605_09480 [Neorhizobium galegae bv. orientalis]|nr:Hypothetical protein NGAL_HAMBI2605_09480 [Neorhizobium galegae bv. orientalis]